MAWSKKNATLPKQEVRRTADVPGTAVRVNRQMGQPKTSPPTDPRTTQQQKRPVRMAGQPARRGPVPKSGSAKETMIGTPVTSDMTTAGRGERKSGATENLSGRRDSWDDRRVTSAERLATSGMSPVGREDRNIASQQLVNVQGRQQGNVTNKDYQSSNRQHLSAPSESNQTNDEVPKRPVSPGIARRQPPPPDNISQAQSRRYAEYGTSSHTKSQPKEYEYPESLDLENESRHSSGCTSPYHQPKQSSQAHHHVKESPIKTHSHNGHGFEQTESEHQPVCTCGQVVYDDIAESQAYLIERNKKKVAQRAAELQAKRDEEDKTHRGDSKDEVHLRPTNRRRNSYELANRDISPTQEKDGERYGERFRPDMSGRPATSKKDLEEPATSARRYKLVDIEGVSKDTRDTQLSGLDHAKLAKLAERELADMERSRAVRDRSQQQARQAYATSQVSPKKNPVSPLQGSPKPHSPQKQITSKTASPARSGTSVSSSPTKTLPSQSSSANSPAKSTSSVEGVKKGVAYGQPLYDKTGLRLSGIHSLDLSGDIGQDRPEEDQFMDADESDEEYDSISRDREDSGRYEDADRGDQQIIGEGAITNTMTEIQAAISQSKNMLLKSPTFYVEKEPEEPVWVLRPFYAKKQLQDEERRRQEQERERQREAVRQEQRGHNRSPTSLGSSDDDLHNRNPQGYLRKQESDDEDDDVEQKPLMSTSDYETGSSSHDHIHSEECYLRNPRPRETFQDDEDLPPSGSKTKEVRGPHDPPVLEHGIIYPAGYLGSTQLICNKPPSKKVRMQQAQEAVSRIKTRLWRYSYQAPEGETQPSTDVDIFISTERVKVLNADSEETMMDHPLKTISYIADIGNLLVIMARRRSYATTLDEAMEESGIAMGDQVSALPRGPKKIICHVFETEDAQLIAQSIGQAFSIAYLNFLKENGIDDPSVTEMDYGEVLSSQEIYGDDLMLFSNKECEKEILIEKERGEIMGVVIVESGWGSLVPTVVIANMSPFGAAARSGKLNIGDQIMSINGTSCVGLPLTTAQQNIKSLKNQCLVKFNVVSCPPVTQVIIKRPDVKYQLGFSVQNGTICSLMRGGIAERGGVRVGHRIIEINGMSVVATAHEKIVDILATAVGEIHMKTMPLSMYRLLTGQEQPLYL
ncbi:uncharacterized protein [Ptychodera flava]|uniref:uncharacterized protein isoform X3 n=1 Tax=Ptychodera flava TaxID=63121 RepID=UPI00396A8711